MNNCEWKNRVYKLVCHCYCRYTFYLKLSELYIKNKVKKKKEMFNTYLYTAETWKYLFILLLWVNMIKNILN